MFRNYALAGALAATGSFILLFDSEAPAAAAASSKIPLGAFEVIDFEGLPAGTILSNVFGDLGSGPIGVFGTNPDLAPANAAVIFDSSAPTGEDEDLGTPNSTFGGPGQGSGGEMGSPFENKFSQFNLLICAEDLVDTTPADGLVDDPDDADLLGAGFSFDFASLGTVTTYGMTIIDVESDEPSACVRFFDSSDVQIGSEIFLPQTGDNGVARVAFNSGVGVSGVARMVVDLNGSGAIDDIVFAPEEVTECKPCLSLAVECIAPDDPQGLFTIMGSVTNCGDVPLIRVFVGNDKTGLLLFLPQGLQPGQSESFSGQYPSDVGAGECSASLTRTLGFPPEACGQPPASDSEPSECCVGDGEGCTPGYWKTHGQHWDQDPGDTIAENAGFTTSTLFHDFFAVTPQQSNLPADITMLEAASAEVTGGGPEHALAWHGIAALLNLAASLDYKLPAGIDNAAELKAALETAWITGVYEPLKADLVAANEAGCPLGN